MAAMDHFLLIIGAMKSGTTSLFKYLADHPEIAPCREKEPHFFVYADRWAKGWPYYTSLWDWDPSRHQIAMEASTGYTKLPLFANAAERIATVDGNFKFVYVMRHPIERIQSHYTHGQTEGWETTKQPLDGGQVHEQLIAVSSYARQLDEYYRRFPAENIKLLLYEDLKTRPAELVTEVCEFIGVDPAYQSEQIGVVHNKNNYRVESKMLKRLRWSGAGRAVASVLPDSVVQPIRAAVGRSPAATAKLTTEQKDGILEALLPDLRRLKSDYGVEIARWGIDV